MPRNQVTSHSLGSRSRCVLVGHRRQLGHDGHIGEPVRHSRPFIDPARSFHEEFVKKCTAASTTASLTPRSSKEKNPSCHDMRVERPGLDVETRLRSSSRRKIRRMPRECPESAGVAARLQAPGRCQILVGDPAGPNEHHPERSRIAPSAGRGSPGRGRQDCALVVAQRGDVTRVPVLRLRSSIWSVHGVLSSLQRALDPHPLLSS